MDDRWYYSREGKACGPVVGQELVRMVADGRLFGSDLLWREGMTEWVTATSLGLGDGRAAPTPPPLPLPIVPPPPPAPHSIAARPLDVTIGATAAQATKPFRRSAPRRHGPLLVAWLMGAATMLAVAAAVYFGAARSPLAATADPTANAVITAPILAGPQHALASGASSSSSPNDKPMVDSDQDASRQRDVAFAVDSATGASKAVDASGPSSSERAGIASAREAVADVSEDRVATKAIDMTAATETDKRSASGEGPSPQPDSIRSQPSPNGSPLAGREPTQRLFQEIDFRRQPKFEIRGVNVAQDIRYQVLSRLHLGAVDPEGNREVTQYIEGTRLLAADEMSRATFASSLEKIKGHQYTFVLNPFHEVIKFTGHKDNRKAVAVKMPAKQGMVVTSVIDRDGWAEIAELTFFKPDPEERSWKRQMTHDWGALGGWSGLTTFFRESKPASGPLQKFTFRHELDYERPKPKLGDPPLAMGMRIVGAEFRTIETRGTIQYDVAQKRVDVVEERFSVQGALQVELLGQPVPVNLTERQVITIQLHKDNPWQQ